MFKKTVAWVFMLVFVLVCSPAWAAVNVLFDASHAQTAGNADWVIDEDSCGIAQRFPTPSQANVTASTAETYWSGAFSAFGIALVQHGYHVESLPSGASLTYGDSSNPQDLTHYDVLVLPEPNVPFSSAEKQAILNFVENGGGLFMISDHAGADRNNNGWDATEVFDDLGSDTYFGIHFNVNTDADSWFNDHPDDRYTSDTNSPIVHGVYGDCSAGKGLGLYGATSMTLHPANNSTVTGHIWKTDGTPGSNVKVTFATAEYGEGRVAAIGDSSPAEDGTNTCGHQTHNGWAASAYDNALIYLNAVAWLAGTASGGGGTGGGDVVLSSGVPTNGTVTASSANGAWNYYTIAVPAGATRLVVTLTNLTGDADLYDTNDGTHPTTSSYTGRSWNSGTADESLTHTNPAAGTWSIGVTNYDTGSIRYTLTATVTTPSVTYSISGTITAGGSPLAGVTVTAGTSSATTNSSGLYTIAGMADGTYTVTPALEGYTFSPASASVTIDGAGRTDVDFTAEPEGGGGSPVERIADGTFEDGLSGSSNTGSSGTTGPWHWTSTGDNNPISNSAAKAKDGSWLAWLNGYGSTETDTLQQSVSIPADATSATLSFDLEVLSDDGTSVAYDTLTCSLVDASGVSHTLGTYSNRDSAVSGYARKTFDVLAYKGQTVTIVFKGSEDYSNATSFYIDDVSLLANGR